MKTTLDLKGMQCPKPVLETQKAFKDQSITEFEVIVDNAAARENLKRLADSKGYKYEVKESPNEIVINIKRESGETIVQEEEFVAVCDIA